MHGPETTSSVMARLEPERRHGEAKIVEDRSRKMQRGKRGRGGRAEAEGLCCAAPDARQET